MKHRIPYILFIVFFAMSLSISSTAAQGEDPTAGETVSAAVEAVISYQGVLHEGGVAVTGSRDMTFKLYSNSSCTTQVGSNIVKNGVSVSNGLFSTELSVDAAQFNGQGLWLKVLVGATDLGCQKITPVPYALSLRPGALIQGDETGVAMVRAVHTGAGYGSVGLAGESTSTAGYGVSGYASSTSGGGVGVIGRSESSGGFGVYGYASSLSGTNYGVYGISDSTAGIGVYGEADAYGVYGKTFLGTGLGVFGYAASSSGATTGVYGRTDSNSSWATGVYGNATAGSGLTVGVEGITNSATDWSRGVYGRAAATSGTTVGVVGESASTAGYGVYGNATSSTGTTYGVYGYSYSSSGRGVNGRADSTSGVTYGTYGYAVSPSGAGVGAYASASSGTRNGVIGDVNGTGYGLYTNDNLYVGGACTGCTVVFIAQNASYETLKVGDVLTVSGVGSILEGHTTPILEIRRATASDTYILGVVYRRGEYYAAASKEPLANFDSVQLVDGDVAPGDYLFVVTSGLAQVRVSPTTKDELMGKSLQLDSNGLAALQGLEATPGAIFAVAMEARPDENGLIWAMIDLR
jgi:hypothetical protein